MRHLIHTNTSSSLQQYFLPCSSSCIVRMTHQLAKKSKDLGFDNQLSEWISCLGSQLGGCLRVSFPLCSSSGSFFTCLLTQFAHILCVQTWGTNSTLMDPVSTKKWPDVLHTYSFCSQPTKVAACQHLKNEVLNCYKQNPTQALKCSQQVRDFLKCVELSQMVSSHSCCHKIATTSFRYSGSSRNMAGQLSSRSDLFQTNF